MAYGVIGNTADFGSVVLGSSPSRPTFPFLSQKPLPLTWERLFDSKGYICTGRIKDAQGAQYETKELWEYESETNIWKRKEDFGGAARRGAVGFSIGNKGYIGTGYGLGGPLNDFWEFSPY